MPQPAEAPTQAPTRTTSPERDPDTGPEWQMDPDVMCPAQREFITTTTAPFLP